MALVLNVNYLTLRVASARNVTEEKCASSLAVFSINANRIGGYPCLGVWGAASAPTMIHTWSIDET